MATDFLSSIVAAEERINGNLEAMLGKGLLMPGKNLNSGSRSLMHSTHRDHVIQILSGEKAILETGYENRFGDMSSSVLKTDDDFRVIAKISKFSFSPNHHYWLILENPNTRRIDVVERISYHHVTESYGYLYNNTTMDSIQVGQFIPKGTIVQKSLSFDEYMNRRDGVNFNVAYMSLDKNMEDSIIYSDVAADKLTSPLIKPVEIMINENDIPLNLYGDENVYKAIPDIGEDVKNSVLIGLRKEKKEESVYTQSAERLRHPMMSDSKYTLNGKVIDINIRCNNPANLDGYYYGQFKMYYQQLQRMSAEVVSCITQYVSSGYTLTYDAQKLFANSKRVLNGDQYIGKKLFSNIILEIVVLEERKIQAGDKASNRYGGKGVISTILPQKLMPRFGDNQYVDVILNSNGVYGRENIEQLMELSKNHIGTEILAYIRHNKMSVDEAFGLIVKFMSFISKQEAQELQDKLNRMEEDEKIAYLNSILLDDAIHVSEKPITESINIDRLAEMYAAFPWVKQVDIEVPMTDSNGNIRYVKARRPIVVGKQYTFRLKQYAEEKFSATSLSATNIRNENTKSKAARDYRELYSNTPIRFGNMETNDLNHLGAGYVVVNLLIHSLSPHARRLTEQMFTDDPFNIDIKLDDESSNRSAEIVNVYLKTIGRRLIFEKKKKIHFKITSSPIYFTKLPATQPFWVVKDKNFDFEKDFQDRQKVYEQMEKKSGESAITEIGAVDIERRKKQWDDELTLEYEQFLAKREKEVREQKNLNQNK